MPDAVQLAFRGLAPLLKAVARSFYLTVRVLPAAIRPQIGLAYLLARATDTLADTTTAPVAARLTALAALRERILTGEGPPLELEPFLHGTAAGATAAERRLLQRFEEVQRLLAAFSPADQQLIRAVLTTITSGQELDLRRFGECAPPAAGSASGAPRPPAIVALPSDADLDDYTYRVAGCVGEFWTKVCRAHLFPQAHLDDATLLINGVRFGKGLQLVNILRDLPRDLRQGRCYLPDDWLARHGLRPADLLDPAMGPRFRLFYENYLRQADVFLADGWAYTNALPRGQVRVRLACAWPILIGARTLARLRASNVLEPSQRVKVTRAEVRRLMLRSVLCYPWAAAWDRQFDRARS